MEIIEALSSDRVAWIDEAFAAGFYRKRAGYFAQCLQQQIDGELVFLLARDDEQLLGYLKVVWQPDYPPFIQNGIPEVQDLNVVIHARRQGVASRLMDRAEELMATRSPVAGIGVGLHPGYGAAQRMYVVRGYIPDGQPLMYNNQPVAEYQPVVLDDDLVLHLTKKLRQ